MGSHRVAAFALFLVIVPSPPAMAEEPLPLVRLRASVSPSVVLSVEPLRDDDFVTVAYSDSLTTPARALEALRDAVATNDYPRFRSTLTQATALADAMPLGESRNALRRNLLIYADVEQLWNFARTDRFGAFFDDESLPGLRDRLAGDYRGLGAFLTENRIIDRNGIELYPTAETRTYLLRLIDAPRRLTTPTLVASATPAAKAVRRAAPRAPRAIVPTRTLVTTISASAAVATPVAAIVPTLPQAAAKADAFAVPPQVAVIPKRTALPAAAQAQVVPSQSTGRGVFFVILALLLLGGLMTMLRAPEAMPTIVPSPDEKPKARRDDEVVPLRKAQ